MGLDYKHLTLIDSAIADTFGDSKVKMLELGNQHLPPKSIIKTGKEYFTKKGHQHISVDINGQDGALVKDLTKPEQFAEWQGAFDIVTNAGTSEHVEPLPQQYECFKIIDSCLKVGGLAVHILPDVNARDQSGLWNNHCSYYYDATFFSAFNQWGYKVLVNTIDSGLRLVVMQKIADNSFVGDRFELVNLIHDRRPQNEGLLTLRVVKPNTMVGRGRIKSLSESVDNLVTNNVPGDFVECGTWRGGLSALMLAKILKYKLNNHLWIYDTFQGMTTPGELDVSFENESALQEFKSKQIGNSDFSDWCRAGMPVVEHTLSLVTEQYADYCTLVEGKVEDTLVVPANLPSQIAMLRLDTDWYDSTRCEFEILFPLVSPGGCIIVDDYSCWKGSRLASDEYLQALPPGSVEYSVVEEGALKITKLKG